MKTQKTYQCKFCGCNRLDKEYITREMMLGLRDSFIYLQCDNCGSLQIREIPADISRYYPGSYVSFNTTKASLIKKYLKKQRFLYSYNGRGIFGKIIVKHWGINPIGTFLKLAGVKFSDAVLDVGSGDGKLLIEMRELGFNNLTGIDPYIDQDIYYDGSLTILKKELKEVDKRFALIIFNHSLEHTPCPEAELLVVNKLIKDGKPVILRLPVAATYAWREYGADWVQLDPPRHLNIPSVRGMKVLAERAGFVIDNIIFESSDFQFWGSEQIKRDIPLNDERSLWKNKKSPLFNKAQIAEYRAKADRLNETADGDMACYILRKKN
ncbi:MAG: class I SAM-dependent methyltransferase [Thermoleophilia bacterium]